MNKKLWSLFLAVVMIVGVIAPSAALATQGNPGDKTSTAKDANTASVTLHKLMMTKEELKNWNSDEVEKGNQNTKGYDGTQNLTELNQILTGLGKTNVKEVAGVYFALKYAKDYSDASLAGKYVKRLSDAKPLTPAMPLAATENVDEAVGGLTTATGLKFETGSYVGKFEIHEIKEKSTYKSTDGKSIVDQKAVPVEITLPLVNKDGTVLNAHVYPKNTEDKPAIDKNFAKENDLTAVTENGALKDELLKVGAVYENYQAQKAKVTANVGKKIPYEVKTKIEAGSGYENLRWVDTMTNGLSYNNDLVLKVEKVVPATTPETQATRTDITSEFTLGTSYDLTKSDRGFTLTMKKAGLDIISKYTKPAKDSQEAATDIEFTLTYSANVNGAAVVDIPETNDIKLEYGHKPSKEIKTTPVTPANGEIIVNKTFDDATNADAVAKNDLKLTYVLLDNGVDVASVTLTKDDQAGKVIELGSGIKFEVTGEFAGKFSGLDNSKNYTFREDVAGFNTEYTTTTNTVGVKNNKDNDNPPPLNPTEPKVVVGGRKFVKTNDGDKATAERLAGAEFYVKNAAGQYLALKDATTKTADKNAVTAAKKALDTAVEEYNALTEEQRATEGEAKLTAIAEKQAAYNKAFKTAGIEYDWVTDTSKAIVLTSGKDGKFEITGLAYGKYKLEEKTAPKGYAKIADVEFTVAAGSYTSKDGDTEMTYNAADATEGYGLRVINKKVTIPQTGGIGTLIFTVAGLSIMAAAVYAMKRNREQEQE